MNKIENSNFNRLIGTWKTKGKILKTDHAPESLIAGTDSYEYILDGHFILHKADVLMGDIKSKTYELIKLENSIEKAHMQYYNSAGESGIMFAFLNENGFKIESETVRFNGSISMDNSSITGTWQQLSENNVWADFLEMQLSK